MVAEHADPYSDAYTADDVRNLASLCNHMHSAELWRWHVVSSLTEVMMLSKKHMLSQVWTGPQSMLRTHLVAETLIHMPHTNSILKRLVARLQGTMIQRESSYRYSYPGQLITSAEASFATGKLQHQLVFSAHLQATAHLQWV